MAEKMAENYCRGQDTPRFVESIIIITYEILCSVFTITYVKQTMFLGCNFATNLYLQFMLLVMLFPMLNSLYFYSYLRTVCSMCTVPHVAVFCNSLMLCFPGMGAQVLSE